MTNPHQASRQKPRPATEPEKLRRENERLRQQMEQLRQQLATERQRVLVSDLSGKANIIYELKRRGLDKKLSDESTR